MRSSKKDHNFPEHFNLNKANQIKHLFYKYVYAQAESIHSFNLTDINLFAQQTKNRENETLQVYYKM